MAEKTGCCREVILAVGGGGGGRVWWGGPLRGGGGGGGDALVAVAVIERWPLVEARMYFDGTNPITGKGIQL